jgi:hypothetical protein
MWQSQRDSKLKEFKILQFIIVNILINIITIINVIVIIKYYLWIFLPL